MGESYQKISPLFDWKGTRYTGEGDAIPIPFNRPTILGREIDYVRDAVSRGHTSSCGYYTDQCQTILEQMYSSGKVLLTGSCTAALEMSALLLNLASGDEVILPSFTHVSTANAFYLRGATLKFADIDPNTLNLDDSLIEELITERTKAIVPVHYAGVCSNLDLIEEIATKHDLMIVEDAAQGIDARFGDRYLGTFGDLACLSFHETKNVNCGEGGALIINSPALIERAEIIHEMGTNRKKFHRRETDKYTWVDLGSSYALSDLSAAFLYGQLRELSAVTNRRCELYGRYSALLQPLADQGFIRLPITPDECTSNHHLFCIVVKESNVRSALLSHLKCAKIGAVFHYVPLHTSPMGLKLGYQVGMLPVTEHVSDCIVRLPLFHGLKDLEIDRIVGEIYNFFGVDPPSA